MAEEMNNQIVVITKLELRFELEEGWKKEKGKHEKMKFSVGKKNVTGHWIITEGKFC